MSRLSKGRPVALEREDRRKKRTQIDDKESNTVRKRSGGRCEAVVSGERCRRKAFHVHHLMGGWGVRGRGDSALAKNKLHLCEFCHRRVHQHVLVHQGGARFQMLA